MTEAQPAAPRQSPHHRRSATSHPRRVTTMTTMPRAYGLSDSIGAVLGGMREWTPGQLAQMAATVNPGPDSPGAGFLAAVRDAFAEAVKGLPDPCVEDLLTLDAGVYVGACLPAPPRDVWGVFVDLGAWEEDLDEVGGVMTAAARAAVAAAGRRLFNALAWWVVGVCCPPGSPVWPAGGVRR